MYQELLGHCHEHIPFHDPKENRKDIATLEYRGFKTLIVRLLANTAYKNKVVQDEIRNQPSGLMLVLSCCKEDDGNPRMIILDFSDFFVRNL